MINITTYDTTKNHLDKKKQIIEIIKSSQNQKSTALFIAVFHGKLHLILLFMIALYVLLEYFIVD